ncbi:hypothetical protein Tco_1209542 [Tanacetum coccineum]
MIAPGSSRNSQEESYGSNDIVHNHYQNEARKKTQERNRNSKSSVMHTTSLQNTTNGSKQKPRSYNKTSRSLPVSKSSGVTFPPNKSSTMHEKTSPRSCIRWKPTGRIFKTVGLRWVPTRKIFTSSKIKVDDEPPNGSNEDITNPYECDQALNGFKELKYDEHVQWCLQTTLQAPFLKEKKSVRFSALYLQKKINLLSYEQSS